MLQTILILMLFGGLFITSRTGVVSYNEENPKPGNYIEEFFNKVMNNFRGLGWEKYT